MGSAQEEILDASLIPFEGHFNNQVEGLLAHVRLTRREVENLQCLFNDLTHYLGLIWPGVHIHPFGSVVTGLGIKTSDVDCYIQIPTGYIVDTPVVWARKILKKYNSIFSQTFAITTAKVPIVKFIHVPTRFNCDINFSSFHGVKNSQLIAFLLNMDRRALPLAIIVKYWSKVYKLTGTNLMPNYGLTMMVIFYLQVKSVLPPVIKLQQHIESQWVDGWNIAFNNHYIFESDNVNSLYELLGGFFNYYKNFNYEQYVISPYMGYAVDKNMLRDLNHVPITYGLYKENVMRKQCDVITLDSPVCIQDPFDHSRNCSVAVFPKLFKKLEAYTDLANRVFNEKSSEEFLRELLTMHPPNTIAVPMKGKPKFQNNNGHIVKTKNAQKRKTKNFYNKLRDYKCFQGKFN